MGIFIRNEMRVIPALISFILFILFIIPVFRGIGNFGSIVGGVSAGILTVIFVFWRQFRSLLSHLWQSSAGKALVCTVSVLTVSGAVIALLLSIFMLREMNDKPENSDTTVVILGCQVHGEAPSLMLKRRLDAAFDYLSEHGDVSVVVSGGQGSDEDISEAQCMRDYLVAKGIAPERIYMEDKSADTDENLRFSKALIEKEGLPADITIVTDGFHQLRADMTAKKLGIKAYNISAATPLWLLPTYWVREWFGIAYYFVRG